MNDNLVMAIARTLFSFSLAVAFLLLPGCRTSAPDTTERAQLDLLIRDGRIVDGTGAPWFRGDVGVAGDEIVAIGNLQGLTANRVIDAGGDMVSPGFIDLLGWSHYAVLIDPRLEGKIRQGVTTELTGEGRSPGPITDAMAEQTRIAWEMDEAFPWRTLGEYLDYIDQQGSALNFALLVGATTVREIVLGSYDVQPTEEQLRLMERLVAEAMEDGAFGLSTSLVYVPALYATTEEIVRLARVADEYGGAYFSHIRSENERIDEAIDEAIEIGRRSGIPVNVWHLKVSDKRNDGKMTAILDRIEEAREEGVDVAANVYPYFASSTGLSALAPNWTLEGGYANLLAHLADREMRERIAREIRESGFYARVGGASGVLVSNLANPELARYQKMYLDEIAAEMGLDPIDALLVLLESQRSSPQAIYFSMKEEDVRAALSRPWVSVGADSGAVVGKRREAGAHPRAYGTFPRVIGHYARDLGFFSIEEAVRKVTSQAASRAGLIDRGILRPGMKADIVIFDPAEIRDLSTFDDPHQFSVGISHVVVNGELVLEDGEMTGALPGRALRGSGWRGHP